MRNFKHLAEHARIIKSACQTGKSFHVAFSLRGGKVTNVGINNYKKTNAICQKYKPTKTHDTKNYKPCIHAEINLMGKLRFVDVSKTTIVVVRINNNNELSNSMPCPNCAYQLGLRNFKQIYYSTNEGEFLKL